VLNELLGRGIVPVVNENDSVVIEELKFGDNDRLSAYVSNVAEADLLVILSHVDGLYDGNPEKDSNAKLIPIVEKVDSATGQLVFQNKNELGTGGMASKLDAAQIGLDFGIPVFITNGTKKGCLTKIFSDSAIGTYFQPNLSPLNARKHWISKVLKPKGEIVVDAGAKDALIAKKRSLLPSGVKAVKGHFERGDCIAVNDVGGKLVAKGLALYSWWEVEKIMGRKSIEIEKILGYKYADEIVHRDDLVMQVLDSI
jgi:glutamate 5-kinase